jgi:hypothetical protein
MRARLILPSLVAFVLATLVSGCIPPPPIREMDGMRALIAAELQIGDSAEEIEAFYERHNLQYTWDGLLIWGYEGIRGVRPNTDMYVRIYVDKDRRFLRSEVDYVYRGLP